jgi:hypothetical protein
MIFDILSKYSSVVSDYQVIKYRFFKTSYEVVLKIYIIDNTTLFVRDYLFADSNRKYSFHWQDPDGDCIYRWDNVPHHQKTTTFPFHKHVGKTETVEDSEVMNLEKVLHFINNNFRKS